MIPLDMTIAHNTDLGAARMTRPGRPLLVATEDHVRRCAEVVAARDAIPSDKALAQELGLDPRTVRWLVERARARRRRARA